MMVLVASIFGYAQWRRQWLIAEVPELNRAYGTNLNVTDDMFWPTVTQQNVALDFTKTIHGDFLRRGITYNYNQLMSYLSPAVVRFRAVGVDSVSFCVRHDSGGLISSEELTLDVSDYSR